jgi:hypothetical protein
LVIKRKKKAVLDEEIRSFTDQSVGLEGRRKVIEKGQSCPEKLHDLYNSFTKESQRIFIIFPRSCSLDERNKKIRLH